MGFTHNKAQPMSLIMNLSIHKLIGQRREVFFCLLLESGREFTPTSRA